MVNLKRKWIDRYNSWVSLSRVKLFRSHFDTPFVVSICHACHGGPVRSIVAKWSLYFKRLCKVPEFILVKLEGFCKSRGIFLLFLTVPCLAINVIILKSFKITFFLVIVIYCSVNMWLLRPIKLWIIPLKILTCLLCLLFAPVWASEQFAVEPWARI